MKVKAKHNLNHNGVWHAAGEEFDATAEDMKDIAPYVSVTERVSEIFPPDEAGETRRGRKGRKSGD